MILPFADPEEIQMTVHSTEKRDRLLSVKLSNSDFDRLEHQSERFAISKGAIIRDALACRLQMTVRPKERRERRLSVKLSDSVYNQLKHQSEWYGISKGAIVRDALAPRLDELEKKKPETPAVIEGVICAPLSVAGQY